MKHPKIYISNVDFGAYLAGLWEGDGHMSIPKPGQKKFNPRWNLTSHEIERPFMLALQRRLGGFIREKKTEHALVLTIGTVPGLVALLNVTHGKYRTPKLKHINSAIAWLNKHHAKELPFETENEASLANDAWLAGFIDADGSFGMRYDLPPKKHRISVRFRLTQRMVDAKSKFSYEPLMKKLSNFLNVNLNTCVKKQGTYFLVASDGVVSNVKLKSYLNSYPLFTSKRNAFLTWSYVLSKLKSKSAYEPEFEQAMSHAKQTFNHKTHADFKHLETL